MSDRPDSGSILGVPYNFERPKLSRLVSSYWQPGEGMLVPKPFGVGYTLNLASWRSWAVLATAGILLWNERRSGGTPESADDDGPVEVIVEDE